MKVFALFFVFGATLGSSFSSEYPPTTLPKQFASDAVQTSSYIGPSIYPGYYIYNYLQVDQGRGIPIGVFTDGRPSVAHLQPTYTYFGTPVYDYRYHFNQLFPGFPGFQPASGVPVEQPSVIPAQSPIYPTTTQRPFDEDDGIEKLDEKLDPGLEDTMDLDNSHPNDDHDYDDSITVDAVKLKNN